MKVGVIGLGYVGLPLAVAFAEAGCDVVGVDNDAARVERLRRSESDIEDVPLRAAARRRRALDRHRRVPLAGGVRVDRDLRADAALERARARPLLHGRRGDAASPTSCTRAGWWCSSRPPTPARPASGCCRSSRSPAWRRARVQPGVLARANRPGPHRPHDPDHAEGRRRPHAEVPRARGRALRADLRPRRAGLLARGGRDVEAARERLSLGQHRLRQRDRPSSATGWGSRSGR